MWGEMPVMMAPREGLQAGAGQCALVNSTPLAARRSRFGVFVCGWPPMQPIQSFRSSIEMNRTLGLLSAQAAGTTVRRIPVRKVRYVIVMSIQVGPCRLSSGYRVEDSLCASCLHGGQNDACSSFTTLVQMLPRGIVNYLRRGFGENNN